MIFDIKTLFGQASNLAAGVDRAFIFIFSVSIFFIVGITAFMIYTLIKFNRKKGIAARQFTGNVKLEIIWTVIPLILVIIMFYYGWAGFVPMRNVPKGAMEITVIGSQWRWDFDYGNGKMSDTLVIPIDKPVKLNLVAVDVNHSLFIPAFRVKEDAVPGYNNYLWFTATSLGKFEILCTEYCGLLHSNMLATTRVVTEPEFETWLAQLKGKEIIPDPEGLILIKSNACLGCHSVDGSKLVGPSFKGLYNAQRIVIEDGNEKTITANDAYIKKSVYDPNADIVKGYSKGLMQSYNEKISEEQLGKIVDYLKTLNETGKN